MSKESKIVLVIVVAIGLFLAQQTNRIINILETGSHLKSAKVVMGISQDTPWEKLPVFIRDDMAKGWSGNKLEKKDLEEIRDYYQEKINNFKGVIAVGEDFKEGKLKKEGK